MLNIIQPDIWFSRNTSASDAAIAPVEMPPPVHFTTQMVAIVLIMFAALLGGLNGQAQEGEHHAGLVIRDQQGELSYAYVAFSEPEISGLELLKRSGAAVVTVGFGGLGEGVCSIQNAGCDVAE